MLNSAKRNIYIFLMTIVLSYNPTRFNLVMFPGGGGGGGT